LKKDKFIWSYIIGISFLALFVLFNPLLVTFILIFIPAFVLPRYLSVIPVAEATGLFIAVWFCSHKLFCDSLLKLFLGGMFFALIISPFYGPALTRNIFTNVNHKSSDEFLNFLRSFDDIVPAGSIVFSDLKTSYILPTAKSVHIVTAKKTFIKTMSEDYLSKKKDVERFFGEMTTAETKGKIAKDYKSDYIVINKMLYPNFVRISIVGYMPVFDSNLFTILQEV
jgi:hypothetical protein